MAEFSRTWWGQRFIAALEEIMDSGRLSRGRSYARGDRVKSFEIEDGLIKAQVRGSVNPYLGCIKNLSTSLQLSLNPSAQPIGQPRSPTLPPKPV